MRYFPAFFDIKERPVIIAGGGALALRKARLLVDAQPQLIFVAPIFEASLYEAFAGRAQFLKRALVDADFSPRPALVIAAHGDTHQDQDVVRLARAQNVPVNVVDQPSLCDFVVPSMVIRGDLVIGISTGGGAPVLGRRIRAQIESMLPARLGRLVAFIQSFRKEVQSKIASNDRRDFWERCFTGPIAALVLRGQEEEARQKMAVDLSNNVPKTGVVHIVGAGPGDPELMTLRALRLCQEADVVLHDNLVSQDIMTLVRRDAERIYVGKKKNCHAMAQDHIGTLMVTLARQGKRVVRLKGGDPFVFGRGAEELYILKNAGIYAEIVPGITAATGCGAAAGIPMTHRGMAQAVTFVTGHAKRGEEPDINWQALAQLKQTLIVYMGVGKAALIAKRFIAAGRHPHTPVAVVEKGTTPDQVVVSTRLVTMADDMEKKDIQGPAILIIGEVAALAEHPNELERIHQAIIEKA